MTLMSSIMRNTLYPYILRRNNRGSVYDYWQIYKESQYWPKEQLVNYQFRKLKDLLVYSYDNCRYYKEVFGDAGITPDSIKSFEDLALLPALTRDLLLERNEDLLSRRYSKSELQKSYSGGTSGRVATMYLDQESYNMKLAIEWRNESWMGKQPCDRTMYFWPNTMDFDEVETFRSKIKNRYVLGQKMVNAGISDPTIYRQYYDYMIRFKPRFIKAFPAAFYGFAEYLEENDLPVPGLEAIMSTAEILYDYQRAKFERLFDCPVYNMYGSRETGNNACECSCHEGLHLSLESAVVEFVDENLRKVEYGQEGQMLITDLTNYGMPFIRYQIDDFAVPLDSVCSCGRELPLIGSITGRLQDFVYDSNGVKHGGNIFLIFDTLSREEGMEVGQIQFIQKSFTHFHVKIKSPPAPTKRLHENVARWIRKILDERIEVSFETVDEIPREKSGKTRYVICEIDPRDVRDVKGN
jgi:phenylacetate-CoA ligase